MPSRDKLLADRREAAEHIPVSPRFDPEKFVEDYNKEIEKESRRLMELEPPGPHEHI